MGKLGSAREERSYVSSVLCMLGVSKPIGKAPTHKIVTLNLHRAFPHTACNFCTLLHAESSVVICFPHICPRTTRHFGAELITVFCPRRLPFFHDNLNVAERHLGTTFVPYLEITSSELIPNDA